MTATLLTVMLALGASAQDAPPMPPGPPRPPSAPPAAPSGGGDAVAAPAAYEVPLSQQPAKRAKKEKIEKVEVSTDGTRGISVDDIYGGSKLRDPFMKLGGAGGAGAPVAAPAADVDPEEFSIHALELKGIMRDNGGMTAMLVDMNTHFGFMLRGGRLYDMRKKAVPGVTGVIQPAQKSVTLTTADKDVQTLRLGEDADEAEE